jgi:pimeloyl-ACP methyl ester carboxylesterase
MMNHRRPGCVLGLLAWLALTPGVAFAQPPTRPSEAIASRTATVDGVTLHYLTAGQGPAIVLLHGFAETSRMWRPLIPQLAPRFTIIAPDLPGIGDSDIPRDGASMTRAAVSIHGLVKELGIGKADVVGHDIGLMVAYAYAAQFPADVEKLVLMDAMLPGVDGWETISAHSHRDDRMAAVVSGTWQFGYGNRFDEAALKSLPAGSVYAEPGGMNHFARTGGEPVMVEISGFGPTDTRYVNPADAPRTPDR